MHALRQNTPPRSTVELGTAMPRSWIRMRSCGGIERKGKVKQTDAHRQKRREMKKWGHKGVVNC